MYCTKKITSDLIWLGGSDRRLALFENVYPIPRGVSYNAYLIQDEKTALLDTVDQAIAERFFENLEHALQGKPLNYVIVNHMEPDHAATLGETLSRHPEAVVIPVKLRDGTVTYDTQTAARDTVTTGGPETLTSLKTFLSGDTWTVARIACFADMDFANAQPDQAGLLRTGDGHAAECGFNTFGKTERQRLWGS